MRPAIPPSYFTCVECEAKFEAAGIVFCAGCNYYQCLTCWDKLTAHKKGILSPSGFPHDKTDPSMVAALQACLREPENEEEQNLKHVEDEETTWFGLDREDTDDSILAEYGRYATIMLETAQLAGQQRFPQLVSFMGVTRYAGKSTLIKLLLDLKSSDNSGEGAEVASPIIGRSESDTPTSADVHLYADSELCTSERPLLYADCEGFDGGEALPIAQLAVDEGGRRLEGTSTGPRTSGHVHRLTKKLTASFKRRLKWAVKDTSGEGHRDPTSRRGFAVSEMYPKILYAFSDVIVSVLNNPKTLEAVVEQMLTWAHGLYEGTINRPSQPRMIIALNKSDNSTPADQWSPENATAKLLNSAQAQIGKNATFQRYLKYWNARDEYYHIATMQDLLRRYYASVDVIRLPHKGRYELLNKQRILLQELITRACQASYDDKLRRQMLLNADELGLYLDLALTHFSESLEEPFDFVKASLKHRPTPATLSEYITTLAIEVEEQCKYHDQPKPLFEKLTPFIASCLMLDAARQGRIGLPNVWFGKITDQEPRHKDTKSYAQACHDAIEEYCDLRLPCHAEYPLPSRDRSCVLSRKSHAGYHRRKGKAAAMQQNDWQGVWENKFDCKDFKWDQQVLKRLENSDNSSRPETFLSEVIKKHTKALPMFYDQVGGSERYIIRSICLGCLSHAPEFVLKCDHVLCRNCVRDFGSVQKDRHVSLRSCPLGHEFEKGEEQRLPELSPPFSGMSVLVLDGGGVRGIVECAILEAIEELIGVPAFYFFDLVVGTSTGGIMALALGHNMWSARKCTENFLKFVKKAFTPRPGHDVKYFKYLQLAWSHSIYRTGGLETALKESFGPENILFDQREQCQLQHMPKVAVVSKMKSSGTYLFANYNARPHPDKKYQRWRPQSEDDECLTWEACTSAAPGYFKPYAFSGRPRELWLDGCLFHNNPVEIALEEWKLLAEHCGDKPLIDSMLSLGTGRVRDDCIPQEEDGAQKDESFLKFLYNTVENQVKLSLGTDTRWDQTKSQQTVGLRPRMHRINPDLGFAPPKMDDVARVDEMYNAVKRHSTQGPMRDQIFEVACILVAHMFFFQKTKDASRPPGSHLTALSGTIACRIRDTDPKLDDLGNFIKKYSHDPEAAVFRVRIFHESTDAPRGKSTDSIVRIPFATSVPASQHECWNFQFPEQTIMVENDSTLINIELNLENARWESAWFSISGFPRQLMKADYGNSVRV
ncbi:hypothetical protein CLAIMM_12685 [Cladophialophora immunda]|nr:hypothetical protein CLAIMM_12685 [Cladophialophora immunda]